MTVVMFVFVLNCLNLLLWLLLLMDDAIVKFVACNCC